MYFPSNITPANIVAGLNDERWNRGFKLTKLMSKKKVAGVDLKMEIGYERGHLVKSTESTGAYNFIRTKLPTCKSDRCECYFNVFQELVTKRLFVKRKRGCLQYPEYTPKHILITNTHKRTIYVMGRLRGSCPTISIEEHITRYLSIYSDFDG